MRKYDISSKEAYLAWVAEWKAEYKALTDEIRALKKELAQPHIVTRYETGGWVGYQSNMAVTQSEKARLRRNASAMIISRQNAKEASWKAKQAALNKI